MTEAGERIALFAPNVEGGGAERVMIHLANYFSQEKVKVDLVLASEFGSLRGQITPQVRVINLNARRVMQSLPKLVEYLRRERPSALLSTLGHTNIVAALAVRLTGKRVTLVLREANFASEQRKHVHTLRQRAALWLSGWAYRQADTVVSISHEMAADMNRVFKGLSHKVVTIYNPVDLDALVAASQEPCEHPWLVADRPLPVLISVGRLEAQKDLQTLLRAFAKLTTELPARLILLGEGSQRTALHSLAQELHISDVVAMPGFVRNPHAYVRRSNVFVLSSLYEGMPNALIEALALGVPIVATDCRSGPAEILQGGKWGRLVPVGTPPQMARAIQEALSTPHELKVAAVQSVKERFGLIPIGQRYLEVLLNAG